MSPILSSALLAATLAGEPAAAAAPDTSSVAADPASARTFPYPVHEKILANGLKVIVVPMPSDGLAAYWSVVRTGSRDEYERGRTGFAHFFEHMMFKGTKKYPQDAYGKIVTEIGADSNAYTSTDITAYHLGIASEDLERVMDIESDRFMNLEYSEAVFKTEAGAVYGEYRKNKANPWRTLFEKVSDAAFKKHTYGHTTMGYERDIKAMPTGFAYSRKFFSRYYRPENVVLFIAGDVDPAETHALAQKYYGGWEKGYQAPKIKAEPKQRKEIRIDVDYDGRSLPIAFLGYKFDAFDPADKNVVGAMLLADLAFGETSEIYKKLVLEESVVQFVSADAGMSRDPGLFEVYSMVKDPAKVDYVIAELEKTMEAYKTKPVDQTRLDDLKSRLRYSFLMGLDSPSRVAGAMARTIAITGGIDAVDTLYATYAAITPADVMAAANRYFDNKQRTVAVLRGKTQ